MLAVQEEERKRKNEEYAKKATLVPELAADVENAVDAAWKKGMQAHRHVSYFLQAAEEDAEAACLLCA